ncbi:hypothetical protein DSECCO2_437680 [anaerobic digester metagenome]
MQIPLQEKFLGNASKQQLMQTTQKRRGGDARHGSFALLLDNVLGGDILPVELLKPPGPFITGQFRQAGFNVQQRRADALDQVRMVAVDVAQQAHDAGRRERMNASGKCGRSLEDFKSKVLKITAQSRRRGFHLRYCVHDFAEIFSELNSINTSR